MTSDRSGGEGTVRSARHATGEGDALEHARAEAEAILQRARETAELAEARAASELETEIATLRREIRAHGRLERKETREAAQHRAELYEAAAGTIVERLAADVMRLVLDSAVGDRE